VIIFPAIDLRHGRCVRLRQGRAEDEVVYGDDPAAVARRWVDEGAEWLHVINLDGAFGEPESAARPLVPWDSGRPVNLERLAEIHATVPATPIQFGGGVRSLKAVELALSLGATRVILGTVAVQSPELIAEAVRRFGTERIAVAIDARKTHFGNGSGSTQVAIHGWTETSNTTAEALGRSMRALGVLFAIYTDIDRDGMLTGLNIEATAALARATGLRVIASGGVASLSDVTRVREQASAGIEGMIIGQALYTGRVSLAEAIRAANPRVPPGISGN
jgi:phosphoribosylformimino-5-aminoimidazole carboxamide ribotide isomerase